MIIKTDNSIWIDGRNTGLKYGQRREGTIVYTAETISGARYAEHKMPHVRYSLAHDAPASGVAGRAQFEADIRAMMGKL